MAADFAETLKAKYKVAKTPHALRPQAGRYLAIDGKGKPGGEAFGAALGQLFAAAYTIKFSLKFAKVADFPVGRVECLYFTVPTTPMDQWRWRAQIPVPPVVTAKHLAAAAKQVKERKDLDISAVKLSKWRQPGGVEVLRIGPYDKVCEAYERLAAFAKDDKIALKGPAQEIYLNDPRRTAPEKLKTIVRLLAK